jgi:hypothetical protein
MTCWNCRQPLQAGSARCIWCGVPQQEAAAPLVVAPAQVAVPVGSGMASAPAVVPPPAALPPLGRPQPVAAAAVDLGPSFRGARAGAGARVVAFTVDLFLVGVVVAAVAILTLSPLFAAVTAFEALLVLAILEARTGATPGKALLQLRASRADAPFSPGGRTVVRGLVTLAGFLVGGVGAWIVIASGAFDSSGRRRSWSDRASGTIVVAVPARTLPVAQPYVVPVAPSGPGADPLLAAVQVLPTSSPGVALPPVPVLPPAPGLAPPQVVSTAAPATTIDESSESGTGVPAAFAVAPVEFEPVAPAGVAAAEPVGAAVLLVFDTGQREQVPVPAVINLGRNPSATEAGDALISVRDPESTVSKTHARLEHSRGRTFVTDGGSTNGSEIVTDEGVVIPLAPGVRTEVEDGSRVRLGNRVFTVSLLLGAES